MSVIAVDPAQGRKSTVFDGAVFFGKGGRELRSWVFRRMWIADFGGTPARLAGIPVRFAFSFDEDEFRRKWITDSGRSGSLPAEVDHPVSGGLERSPVA